MPCSGPLGANLSSSSHGSKGAWGTFVHLGEGGKPDHGREHWLGVGGWVFAIPQLLTLNLSFHHPETVMPTSVRGMVHSIPWDDTCVQSVLHPSMISNACGFSCPPRVWRTLGWGYIHATWNQILLSLSWRCLGLVCGGGGEEHIIFRHMVSPALLPGRGAKEDLPFVYLLCEVLRREKSEVLWVDKGSKMELIGAQEMLSLPPYLGGEHSV